MGVLKMDQKGRIHLSKKVRKLLGLKSRQAFIIEVEGNEIRLSKLSKLNEENDKVLRDMIKRPLHLKGVNLTKKLLDALEEEVWLS